jgi:hypothetical protein
VSDHVVLDIGVASDGRIVLIIRDVGLPAETEIAMSLAEARGLVKHLEAVIAVAAALPKGRRISLKEGRA